ncbi:MAG TPA: hypothetical protein VG297_01515 [Bryobacteraceae bacterium]|nr:hypothetical protein [Bryobacteraceae bacterium]
MRLRRAGIGWPGIAAVFSAGALVAASPGIRPRPVATDYPVRQSSQSITVGAVVIARKDVRKIFKADLNAGGYIAVEIGIFPLPGMDADISPGDFLLRTGTGEVVRSADPGAIATALARSKDYAAPKHSDVYTTTGIDVIHGTGVDPASGRQTGRTAVGTEAGVGIGAPPGGYPYPYPSAGPNAGAPNVGAMEQELWEKSLPDGKTSVPVAGYLYFPKPSGRPDGWELTMDGREGRVRLVLPRQ